MSGKDGAIGSDLAKVDVYELGESDYAEIPELDEAWFARAVPHRFGRPLGSPKSRPKGKTRDA